MAIGEFTEEEYNEAKEKLEELKNQLFNLRYEIVKNEYDEETLQNLNQKIENIKRETSRTIYIIKEYETFNIGRKRR